MKHPGKKFRALAAALGVSCAAMLASSPSRAYCRYYSTTPPAWDPVSSGGCYQGGSGGGDYLLFWAGLCAGYSIQQDASLYVTLADATTLAAEAFAAWSAAQCSQGGSPSIQAVNVGTAACSNVQYNQYQPNQNVIIFRDDGWPSDEDHDPGNLALTTVQYYNDTDSADDPQNGQILGADMEVNESNFRLVADPSTFDAGSGGVDVYPLLPVLMHEAGHFLGLAHSADENALMYAFYHASSAAGLTQDDSEGICATALPGGLRLTTNAGVVDTGAVCDPTPTNGFQSECGDPDAAALATGDDGGAEAGAGDNSDSAALDTGGCSVGASSARSRWFGAVATCALGIVLAMRRLARRRRRSAAVVVLLALATLGTALPMARDATASTSVEVTFEELVHSATAVAVITPIELHAARESGRAVTHVRAKVASLIAGSLPDEIVVRTLGGVVDRIGEIVEGQASFAVDQPVLVFVRPSKSEPGQFAVVALAQGQFPVVTGPDAKVRIVGGPNPGALVPPGAHRLEWLSKILPPGATPRPARALLAERTLEDVRRLVVSSWDRLHRHLGGD